MYYFKRVKKFLAVVFVLAVFVMVIRYISEVRLKTIVASVKEELAKDEISQDKNFNNDTPRVNLTIEADETFVQTQVDKTEDSDSDSYKTEDSNSAGYKIEDSDSDSYIIEGVPHICQTENYPTGCESVAAVSLMQYYNIDITVDEFIDCYLQMADAPYYDAGILKGESPWEYFIGNPRSEYGFGCYSTVIEKAMNEICSGSCDIKVLTDTSLEDITKDYVANGIPVMIWATVGMMEPCEGDSWELPSGEIFTFIRPEHALLLVGYDSDNYYFSDSMVNEEVVAYSRSDCERAFNAMGSQAIVVIP